MLSIGSELGRYEVAKYAQKRALSTDGYNPEVLLPSGIYFTEMRDDKTVSILICGRPERELIDSR